EPASPLRRRRRPGVAVRPEPPSRRPAADRRHPDRSGRGAHARHPRRARRRVRVTLHRCFAWARDAEPDEAGGALWFARAFQGDGRHDNPERYGCLYVAELAVSAIVEQLARFRGSVLVPGMLRRRGLPLALATLELDDRARLVDLDR